MLGEGRLRFPLEGVRVLDLTDELGVAGPRLLAAMGAEVIRAELPDGDAVRSAHPRYRGPDAPEQSLAHLVYNAGKESVTVDWRTDEGRHALAGLIDASDITICSRGRPLLASLGIDPGCFAVAHPSTTLVVLDAFPSGSPWNQEAYEDLTLSASGGFAWLCGSAEGPPEHPKGRMASTYAAISASLAALVGLVSRQLSGQSGVYELSAQEAVAFSTCQGGDPNPYLWYGDLPSRKTWAATSRRSVHRCADGKLVTFVMMGARFKSLIDWLDEAGVSDRFRAPEWQDHEYYNAHLNELSEAVAELCSRYSSQEIAALGQARMLMVMPVNGAEDLVRDPQLLDRKAFAPVPDPIGTFRVARAPMVFSRCDLPAPRPAPATGACDPEVLRRWLDSRPAAATVQATGGRLPLSSLRVADFTWMLAAPLATRFLADFGADVVRIESHARRDLTREIGTQPPGFHSLDTNSHQHHAGCNKRSIALDLRHKTAIDTAARIIASSDIVLDNYRPGTMSKWGFSPRELLERWPHLIVVTMPAVGSSGPHAHFGAVGNGVAAYAGINSLTGFPENPPWGVGPVIADFFAPLFTVHAIMGAVYHRAVTGEGQHVDCPMLESTLWLMDTAIAQLDLLGAAPERNGNRDPWMSPHGIFQCVGEDNWIAVAVRSDAQWRAFCRIAGLSSDDSVRFARAEARLADPARIERVVAAATRTRSAWQLARELQAAGVPAVPVEHVVDHLANDPGMRQRFTEVSHPYGMTFAVQNQFIRPGGVTVPNRRAPMIGEHSDEILRDLGLSEEEVSQMFAAGILH